MQERSVFTVKKDFEFKFKEGFISRVQLECISVWNTSPFCSPIVKRGKSVKPEAPIPYDI